MIATRTRSIITAAAVLGLLSAPAAAHAASVSDDGSSGRPLAAELSGANEVGATPGAFVGDPDGMGTANVTVNVGQGELCYDIAFTGVAPIFGHVHVGEAGVNGPVVITLAAVAGADGVAAGCVDAPRELLRDIVRDPSAYYVNIHSDEFRAGAIRGQLER